MDATNLSVISMTVSNSFYLLLYYSYLLRLWDLRLLVRMTIIIEWVSIDGMNMVARVVFRAINRIFVGLPFCEYTLFFCPSRVLYPQNLLADVYTESGRNDDFMQVNVEHAIKLVKARHTIERFPIFMREWVP